MRSPTAISFELMDEQSVATKVDPRWSRAVVTVMNAGNVGILGSGPIMAGSIMLNPGGLMR